LATRFWACWVTLGPGPVSRHPGQKDYAALKVDEEQDVDATEHDRVDMKEVAGKGAGSLGSQELRPRRARGSRAPDVHGDDVARYGPSSLRRSGRACGTRPRCGGSPSADGVTGKTAQRSLTEQSGESGQDGTIGRGVPRMCHLPARHG
jgi:hypothetical protein